MIKKRCIYLLFFFSYAVVLMHEVVPHFHHDEKKSLSQDHEDDHDKENSPIGNLFAHFHHHPGSKDFTYPAKTSYEINVDKSGGRVNNIVYTSLELSRLAIFPENINPFFSPLAPSELFFRGPPYLS